ncbi:MAG TPA: FAD-binding oxidoreductase [Armatimonadaceae bacterium]|nr:FAD-binding oxidoreductase [Armatimonadaceae bacterium]
MTPVTLPEPDLLVPPEESSPAADAGRAALPEPLPADRLQPVGSWGGSQGGMAYAYRPTTVAQIREVFALARSRGLTVGLRGAGRSYGDASMASENVSLDLTRMNRILDWDPETGLVTAEPGVTIRQLWQYAIEDGWWPPVVSGTMFPTLGGALSMNIHGKNNYAVGPIGDHVLYFDLLLPGTGEIVRCSRVENPDLFHGAIGGFGVLGVFVRIALKMKQVSSGLLRVNPISVANLSEMFRVFEQKLTESDYLVGWIDCFGEGAGLGRGLIHQANYLAPGEDPVPAKTLRVENQELPDTVFGVVPKGLLWRFMRPFVHDFGVRAVNAAKYWSGTRQHGQAHTATHAGFAFLLDYVPDWKKAYGPGGLIQYQSFLPKETAEDAFREHLLLCERRGLVPYLGVFKRHRPDAFLMTHAVDGYSLALDFKVTARSREPLWSLAAELDAITLRGGGRFYFAKDSTLHAARLNDYLSEERVRQFLALKQGVDPEGLLQTDLYRRLFATPVSGYK